ncbi:MAG TPA: hypothetical protein VFH03_00575 [Actinoplanes sp.]|nr:hypothetical protein [Actinoplanes sp.]
MTPIIDLVHDLPAEVPWWAWVAMAITVFGGLLVPDPSDDRSAQS